MIKKDHSTIAVATRLVLNGGVVRFSLKQFEIKLCFFLLFFIPLFRRFMVSENNKKKVISIPLYQQHNITTDKLPSTQK